MSAYAFSRILLSVAAAAAAWSAQAQNIPPIKPGLWQVHSESEVDGKKAPDMTENMKNLPPEARKQMEAMMKQRGVDMSGGDLKICLSKESLQKGAWEQAARDAKCITEYTAQTTSRWAWKSICSAPIAATTEGETVFSSPEAYTVKTATTMTVGGKTQQSRRTMTSKWLAGDCGDVKPVSPKP